eukprot:362716-Chlamydomonas_euryale.AAC.13
MGVLRGPPFSFRLHPLPATDLAGIRPGRQQAWPARGLAGKRPGRQEDLAGKRPGRQEDLAGNRPTLAQRRPCECCAMYHDASNCFGTELCRKRQSDAPLCTSSSTPVPLHVR